MACELCELVEALDADGALVSVGRHWTANVRQGGGRPAIVLQVRAHRHGLESLEPAEAAELGAAVQRVARLLEGAPGVERVYAQSFNETPGQHVHVHVTPRFRGERDLGPNALVDVVPPADFDVAEVVRQLDDGAVHGGVLTRRIRRGLRWVTRVPIAGKDRHPYSYLRRNVERTRFNRWLSRHADAGEQYVMAALVVEAVVVAGIVGLAAAGATVAAGVLAVILLLRVIDIASSQLDILLMDEESALQGHGRSLLLALANLAELGLVSAGVLVALGLSFDDAVLEGARVSTLQSELTVGVAGSTPLLVATMCTALLVAVGSIGVVIAKIGDTFHRK
ncbi:MAG TPA: hypothetical protein VIP77_03670 [Jiangellaceae bacterium]